MIIETSVIVLNWNGKPFLKNCLDSVFKQSYRNFEVIFVDNGSNDGSVGFVKKGWVNEIKNKKLKIIANDKNYGFAEGNNIGARSAAGKYIVLLNNDTIVDKNWLKELVTTIKNDPSIGSVSSAIWNKYSKKDYRLAYGTSCFFGQNTIDPRIPVKTKRTFEIFGMGGGACILRNEKKQIFDPDYFIYSEDTAFGWLKRLQGYKNKLNPKSIVFHEGEESMKKVSAFKAFLQERNRLINAVIFYQIGTLLKLSPLLLANLIAATVYDIGNIIPRLKAWFWIISHFPRLMKKRKAIQKQRKVSDREIVRYMSCKFYEEELLDNKFLKKIIKFFNKIQCGYCYITGIRTIEFFPISFD